MSRSKPEKWIAANLPDMSGRVAVVTGSNSGVGYEAALALAGCGAEVVLACRRSGAADQACARISAAHPGARVSCISLDLADLDSVRAFAAAFRARHTRLDVLINNAGLMMLPRMQKTADGFETHFGVNHLGHFALTGLLLDRIRSTPGARVVTVTSALHVLGRIDFSDLQFEKRYHPAPAYGRSKLANLLFAHELHRRLAAAGCDTLSLAAHPGWASTNLLRYTGLFRLFDPLFGQSAAMGALPILYAAAAVPVEGGAFYAPARLFHSRGFPVTIRAAGKAYDPAVARRLWEESERLTGVSYALTPAQW